MAGMTEQMAEELAAVLCGETEKAMPGSRSWGVLATCTDGRFVAIEDVAGWAYRDRKAYETYQQNGDQAEVLEGPRGAETGTRLVLTAIRCAGSGENYSRPGFRPRFPSPIGMELVLQEAGWRTCRVSPCGDLQWVHDSWFPAIRRAIVRGKTGTGNGQNTGT